MKKSNRLSETRESRKKILLRRGAYLVITDAKETEKHYFEGIKKAIPEEYKRDLQIKIYENKPLAKIIDFAAEQRNKDERFRNVWLVFDRDQVKNFDVLIENARDSKMSVAWSNPCFEIWMMGYFKNLENITDSQICCSRFENIFVQRTGKGNYNKTEEKIYSLLFEKGDEEEAIQRARIKYHEARKENHQPSKMIGCTTVYKLVEELREKMEGEK